MHQSLLPEVKLEKSNIPFPKKDFTCATFCMPKLPVSITCMFRTLLISNQLLNHVSISSELLKSQFSQSVLPPCPLAPSQAVCGMWFGFLPKDYSVWENKAPQCALFSTFLSPDISPAAGRTLPQ